MTAAQVAERIPGAVFKGGWWKGLCPAHPDKTPSLCWRDGDVKVVFKCQSQGCLRPAILAALGLTEPDTVLVPKGTKKSSGTGGKIIETYDYKIADGTLSYQVLRYEPKSFKVRRPDPAIPGGWIWNQEGVTPIPYNLDKLQGQKACAIAEG